MDGSRTVAASTYWSLFAGLDSSFNVDSGVVTVLEFESDAPEHLENLFNMSMQLHCVATTDGYFRRLNPAWERTLGYSIDELLATPFLELVHPADRTSTLRQLKKLAGGRPVVYFENRYRCRDGSYRRLAWTSAPHSDGILYATALDITVQDRATQLFSRLIDSAPDAMVITRRDGTIDLVNRLCEQLFLTNADELIGKPIEILIPERLRAIHESRRRDYMEKPKMRPMGAGLELVAVRADGVEFPAEISLGPLTTDEEMFIVCAIRDITGRMQHQDALLRSEGALKSTKKRLNEQELELFAAERIQMHLNPKSPPDLRGYDIAAKTLAAEFTAGDLHDFLSMGDGCIGLVVGDVTGHGFSASLLSASTHAYLRALVETYADPRELIEHVHSALHRELEPERFVSMILARLNFQEHTLTYVNAGHPSGYVLDESGNILASMDSVTWPLATMPTIDPREIGPIHLQEGQLVLLMTDGILEAESPTGEDFGLDRVLAVARERQHAPAAEILDALYRAVKGFTSRERPLDDITVIVVKRVAEPIQVARH
jgi:sigma-B regulation protein RsbU (phosphoserine phosphatase)